MLKSKYFKTREFACRCGCGYDKPSDVLVKALDSLREASNAPISITGPLRCANHNRSAGGASNSRHLPRHADGVDIKIKGKTVRQMVRLALSIPEFKDGGIGIYHNRIHVDTRGKKARWEVMSGLKWSDFDEG